MIFDKKKHTTQKKYPNKTDFKYYYVYSKGQCLASGDISAIGKLIDWSVHTASEYPEVIFAQLKNKGYIIETYIDEDAYEHYKKEYYDDKAEKHKKYLDDLYIKEYSLSISREVFTMCFNESWSRHHSGGYPEVENNLMDIVEFAINILAVEE